MEYNADKINGKTIIDHKRCVLLNLNMAEYAIMMFSEDSEVKKRMINEDTVWRHLGLFFHTFTEIRNDLERGGFLSKGHKKVTPKWTNSFGDVEGMFEQFWAPEVINDVRYRWRGSKEEAFICFKKVIKERDLAFLLKQKHHYFTVVNEATYDRQVIGGAVWLNPSKKKYDADWYAETKEGLNADKVVPKEKKPVVLEDNDFENLMS